MSLFSNAKLSKRVLTSTKLGFWTFSVLILITLGLALLPKPVISVPIDIVPPIRQIAMPHQPINGLKLSAKLSQDKLLQFGDGRVYLEISIDTPTNSSELPTKKATDLVIVLDRSGSMSVENRLPYAKEAVRDLLGRLNSDDRFALVAFDTEAQVFLPLQPVSPSFREQAHTTLAAIQPGSSTNIGAGLELAKALLAIPSLQRQRKIILLSDGEVNTGIVDPKQLAALVSQITVNTTVVSTIGMGLDFNEQLIASLADYGMGSYAYLASLSNLSELLAKYLDETRSTFAAQSFLELSLPPRTILVDAAGYPFSTNVREGNQLVSITSGQLLSGSSKKLVLTLTVPTTELGQFNLGKIVLRYTSSLGESLINSESDIMLAVIEPFRHQEYRASINQEVYEKAWLRNNFGRMKKSLAGFLKAGDKKNAKDALSQYRNELSKTDATAGTNYAVTNSSILQSLDHEIEEAFSGTPAEQTLKQKAAAKESYYDSRNKQR